MNGRTLSTIAGTGLLLLVLNTAYVASFSTASIPYMGNVLLHLILGVVVVATGGAVLLTTADLRRRLWLPASFFAASAAFAVALVTLGNLLEHRWILNAHIVLAALALAALLPFAMQMARTTGRARQWGLALPLASVVAIALPLATGYAARLWPDPAHRIVNPATVPASMDQEGGGPSSPFFPSSAQTNVGGIIPSNFFMDSAACGTCHKDVYEQWKSSVHHFASFNNQFYRKSIEYMQSVVGTKPSKWCAGCHDHAVFFNGRFDKPIKDQIDTPEAHAGLACTSCHAITHVDGSMGNGGFTIEYPPLHELMASKNRLVQSVDSFMTYLNPEPHRRTFMKPFMREDSAEYCAACHKVHLDVPVNDYRWFRGFNDYDNWQASAVSGQGARSFYYPESPSTCVSCHMPRVASGDPGRHGDGTVHSHRFAAANTAVPFVNHDQTQLKEVEAFLKSGFISVDVFAVSPVDESTEGTRMVRRGGAENVQAMSGFGVGEEAEQAGPVFIRDVGQVAAPIDKTQPALVPGSTARVDVVVRTRKIGHFFPGGTVDAFDIWLELQGRDATGRLIYWSGRVDDEGKGAVEPGAHFYRAYQLDGEGNPINKRNAWATRSVAYVRLIPPGAADTVHYRLQIPKDAGATIFLRAKVNYRKFAWWNTQWAYAGVRDPSDPNPPVSPSYDDGRWQFTGDTSSVSGKVKAIPDIPITVMAESKASLDVIDARAPLPAVRPVMDPSVRERWNDYGIGLLLQGDLKGARAAFTNVIAMDPGYADGPVNVARAQLQEGEVDAAIPMLEQALKISPRLAKAHFFLGSALKTLGRYEEALEHLQVAVEQYPRDRVVLNEIGRIRFLNRQFDEAIATFKRALDVDPEDLDAHYNLMLAYQGKGDSALAAHETTLYTRFKADETAQAITGPYRLTSPHDNNERQLIHEHKE